ncbi:hypothetical protein [Krasilnikovia sp. MM14-A1004]|uniref:hypothetical protein n=1 Tax=Krasilnikovia sp. MM14-A1004 TaxID=3373541 RepID=UPI00399D5474
MTEESLRSHGGVVLRRGLRLHVPDADYKYGRGDIDLVVRTVLGLVAAGGEHWVELAADEVLWDHSTRSRLVQVRVSALRGVVAPDG